MIAGIGNSVSLVDMDARMYLVLKLRLTELLSGWRSDLMLVLGVYATSAIIRRAAIPAISFWETN